MVASSKKSSSSKGKSTAAKAEEAKIEDAVIIEDASEPDETPEVSEAAPSDDQSAVDEPSKDVATAPEEDTPGADPAEPETEKAEDAASDVVEPAPGDATETKAASAESGNNSFLPLVLGGIIAGILGFLVGQLDLFGKDDAAITTKLRADLNAQHERIAALEEVEPLAVEPATVDLSPIRQELEEIASRITALEERPPEVAPQGIADDAAAAYMAELATLTDSVKAQRDEIAALIEDAQSARTENEEAVRRANAQAALARIVSALDTGAPYDGPIEELKAQQLAEVDPALDAVATEGVATLSALQAEFPAQARIALATARSVGAGEGQQGIGSFLKRSLGARSVSPREGDDPDAVLSRAEAALQRGDLTEALNELDALPEEAQAAIADWRAAADARAAARAATDALAKRLTAD